MFCRFAVFMNKACGVLIGWCFTVSGEGEGGRQREGGRERERERDRDRETERERERQKEPLAFTAKVTLRMKPQTAK